MSLGAAEEILVMVASVAASMAVKVEDTFEGRKLLFMNRPVGWVMLSPFGARRVAVI